MSIQTTVGSSALIGIGIGAGDVATLVNVGRRIGNWLTAPKSDADFLALLEGDESAILRRRGIMDSTIFNKRWDVRMRLLENGRAQRKEGRVVERLLKSHSQWTGLMICIVAALDEFASASTVRLIIKMLLRSLFSTEDNTELNEDLISSSLTERINGWRSAATVREMNTACRLIRNNLIRQQLAMQGYIPEEEADDISSFLYWLLTSQDSEDYRTASSDLAGIACCLCHLSFDILSVEGFDTSFSRTTPCRVVYSAGHGSDPSNGDRSRLESLKGRAWRPSRELSTIVSLTQPEETFSTFPISRALANKCRVAWELGARAAHPITVDVRAFPTGFMQERAADFKFFFANNGTSVASQTRTETNIMSLCLLWFIFCTEEVIWGLKQALANEPSSCVQSLYDDVSNANWSLVLPTESFKTPGNDTVHIVQAFLMGYWYAVLDVMVDTSDLDVQTVSGQWGYLSTDLWRELERTVSDINLNRPNTLSKDEAIISPPKVLRLIGLLYANIDVNIPENDSVSSLNHQSACVGIIGKRTVLCRSLLRNSRTPHEAAKYVILDCDVGGIPRSKDGLVTTNIKPANPLEKGYFSSCGPLREGIRLRGAREDCTRHIQADWDGDSGDVLLCIRYRGRRIATVNPAFADRTFLKNWQAPSSQPELASSISTPAWEVTLEDFVKQGGLPTPAPDGFELSPKPSNFVIVVQSRGNDCFRYAAAAWYAEICEVVLINGDVQEALNRCIQERNPEMVALIA